MYRTFLASSLLLTLTPSLAGCSSDVVTGREDGSGAERAAAGAGGSTQFAPESGESPAAGTLPAFGQCVAELFEAEATDLDLYVLFDQSGSMSTPEGSATRLDVIRGAMADFMATPESAGVGFGIGYFGQFPIGEASCDPADYARPAVPIAQLPAHSRAIADSLNVVTPTGETPTGPALRGTCGHLIDWKAEHPGRHVALLLLTDGVPEAPVSRAKGCSPTLANAVASAQDCRDAGVAVHVLGVGPNLENLHRIAEAGGTEQAHLVAQTDAGRAVFEALIAILGSALPCALEIPDAPEGQTLDYERVNVVLTDRDGQPHVIEQVDGSGACDGDAGGWYYSSRTAPERIELCGATCDSARAQSNGGSLEFALGCETLASVR